MFNDKIFSSIYIFAIVVCLCSCSKNDNNLSAWTMETGVSVLESKICDAETKDNQISVIKKEKVYIIEIDDTFSCNATPISAWVTVEKERKATLVLKNSGKENTCECRGKVRLQISDRLEPGNTLYLLNDKRVLGHIMVP